MDKLAHVNIGDILVYVLPPHHRPRYPDKRWRGVILSTIVGYHYVMFLVQSLEEGYEDCTEVVQPSQIISIEPRITTD
jgi:hypothetical protein